MRETKDRVMLFFCEKTNRKIENLDTKTTILKNLSIRNAGMAQILQEGASLKIFHKKQLKNSIDQQKNLKYESRSGKSHGPCIECEPLM